ncbi:hypothetical protein HETIRDRAFT_312340 [Heterobasidion irregulare TC 32-1]|uniref:Uncharacterized protein n=1 Tax=Heterobasidion irregulare (strain TC 32-1) TaxID=747525 RepID=W4KD24_HETIT|nr:uncharacterized protein HETIRDRAFT_312340 [Heterobasidion irregulare TC 32-1]ETW83639.1 hypothetical protein HETIRDRAFT_312340 [Heterobasidion irregulare TC 32-1]
MITDTEHHENTSPLGLVAHCSAIQIEGKLLQKIGLGGRFLVVYVDDEERWKSKRLSSRSPLHWQQDHHMWLRPSSNIKIELFRKSTISIMRPSKRQFLGKFCAKLVHLLGNDAAFDMTDDSGNMLDGIQIKIKLALISHSPRDITDRVDAAISRLDDSILSQISKHVNISESVTDGVYSSTQMISSCIPALGQTFQAMVKIARIFGDASPSYLPPITLSSW